MVQLAQYIPLYENCTYSLFSTHSEFASERKFVRMCQKTDKRYCVKTEFSSSELRIWNHFCFTADHINVDDDSTTNLTMKGYLNGVLFKTSKSLYCR